MAEACDVADAYEYSNGFVIAISEFRISGVRGVLDPKSIPTPSKGGVESDVLKLYIFPDKFSLVVSISYQSSEVGSLLQPCLPFRVKQMTFHKFFWLFCVATREREREVKKDMQRKQMSH